MENDGSSSKHVIPGPAGKMQGAVNKWDKGKMPEDKSLDRQNFLEKCMNEPEYDDSFTKSAWMKVIEYGYLDLEIEDRWPISKCNEVKRVDRTPLVVGIVESVEAIRDGLGCLMVVLKDETGKVSGNVHYKVANNPKWKGKIKVNNVLVIGNAAIFRNPRSNNRYLNITENNLQDVFEC